jgi:Dehydrogenases with different specificities (related to short-chain alcohol dehydrogenases)
MAQDRPAALVTGSASGIGRAAALRLARAGYDVAINYSRSQDTARTTLAELESLGGRHVALRADVSDDAAVTALTAEVGQTFGRLDALVNNAGMTSQTAPDDLDGVDLAEWDRVFAVNVRGCSRSRGPARRCCGRRGAAW